MISVNRLRDRKSDFDAGEWMMDSGAFTEISTHGRYRTQPAEYVAQVRRWSTCGRMIAAVGQDYMGEPFIIERTVLSVEAHQALTIERYVAVLNLAPDLPWLPVMQGFAPSDYIRHLGDYGRLLQRGAWVGVGSVCKRNASPTSVEDVMLAIHAARPDLRLHGFGLKKTALASGVVHELLYSADSMAWSWAARRERRNANCLEEAARYADAIRQQEWQRPLLMPTAVTGAA